MAISIDVRAVASGLLLSSPALAATTVGDIDRYFEASRRLEAGEAIAPRLHYQAGFYAGYLDATRE